MHIIWKIIKLVLKIIASILLIALMLVFITSISPIYRFRPAEQFSGPDIFNPYKGLDTAFCWKRANFHTHTRVEGVLNECEKWPGDVYNDLKKFGYDIVTFSNHNELTTHPFDTALQVNVYEHGYNLFKYHKLVFGCQKVHHFDHLLPILASQKQFQLDYLGKESDMIQLNHPLRTEGFSKSQFEKISGYSLMELDSGISTENEYWDWALSAGHYSFGLANDDLHHTDRTHCIAVRCNFLCCPSAGYEDIRRTLSEGTFYAMRVPDYGNGDWDVKYAENLNLPYVKNIGLIDDGTIYMSLSEKADSIKIIGQGHSTLSFAEDCSSISYPMSQSDSYARITAWFEDGEVIYSNPFARYDSSTSGSPFDNSPQDVNVLLSILFNLLILALTGGCMILLYFLIFKR